MIYSSYIVQIHLVGPLSSYSSLYIIVQHLLVYSYTAMYTTSNAKGTVM